MTKRSQIIAAVILMVLILIVAVIGLAMQRGALSFAGGKPSFNLSAMTNPRPSLDRRVSFPADFTAEMKSKFNADIEKLKARIETKNTDIPAWLDLAIYYRMIGDTAAAVEIWEYVAATYPTESVALHNLGEHYFHSENDYPKAEEYYRRSITVQPNLTQNYTDLYEMYRYVYKQDTASATDILLEGITKVGPVEAIDLKVTLARHYVEKGDTVSARKYFTEARDSARTLKITQLVNQLNAELARLK
jgi:tetratricopeptide (TPR) repeat protein